MPIISTERRKLWTKRIRNFWQEYRSTKVGVAGLILLILFVLVAIFGPWLTMYDPVRGTRLGESYAMPAWLRIFPQFQDLPVTAKHELRWVAEELPFPFEYGKKVAIKYRATSLETIDIDLVSDFFYEWKASPRSFNIRFTLETEDVKDLTYLVQLYLIDANDNQTRLWSYYGESEKHRLIEVQSTDWNVILPLGYKPGVDNLAEILIPSPGTYDVMLSLSLMPKSEEATIDFFVQDAVFNIPGLTHGILGCDNEGRDLFSQLIYGTRISLAIGLLAAFISTFLGVFVGVIAGYVGGVVDEISMRIVDVLLCLPVLPLLLALIFVFGPNVIYIVVLIAIFGWQGLSRVIRSQILSIREAAFVECAKASGASQAYIIFRHLVPNVLPIAFASLVLSVPGAILTEASLSFLGFGDPRSPTWGKMLQSAFGFGAFSSMAWWWILPPGLAITFVCLSFVFIGHAVDNIANPRLRRRR